MTIASGRELGVFYLDTPSSPQRPASDLGAKAGEDEHLCIIKAKFDICDLADTAATVVNGGAPFGIVQVPYPDGILVGDQNASRGGKSTVRGRPAEAEKSGGTGREIDGAYSLEAASSTDIEATAK